MKKDKNSQLVILVNQHPNWTLDQELDEIVNKELKKAKSNLFKINNMRRNNQKYKQKFEEQLRIFDSAFAQLKDIIKNIKKFSLNLNVDSKLYKRIMKIINRFNSFKSNAEKVRNCCIKRELNERKLKNEEKVFSIYEDHTDIIIKGGRKTTFGHKLNLTTGKGSLIFGFEIPRGNPSDTNLYASAINIIKEEYSVTPESVVTDGGYANIKNLNYAKKYVGQF